MPSKDEIEKLKSSNPSLTFRAIGLIFGVTHVRILQIYHGTKKTEEYRMIKRHQSHMIDSVTRKPCELCIVERKSLVTPLQVHQYTV